MTDKEAINYLKQLYPNGGHSWLDEQRIDAIGMAIKALQQEPANDSFEDEVKRLWEEINTGHSYSIVDSYNQFYGLCLEIADWQKEQMLAKAVKVNISNASIVSLPVNCNLKVGDKVLIIKED
jgi:hypothetical protein